MKINEVVLNEGWYDDAKAKVAGGIDAVKQSKPGQAVAHHAGELGKMGSDVGSGLGDLGDYAKGKLYQYTGFGGKPGNTSATRTKFTNDFSQQFKLAQRSARQGGVDFSVPDYVQAYLRRYNWYATPEQLEQLSKITDPTKLANAMYAVGIQQSRDKYGHVDDPRGKDDPTGSKGNAAMSSMANQLMGNQQPTPAQGAEDQTIEPQTQQLMKTVKTMKGGKFEKDLEEIVKLALWNLYGTDKQDYSEFVKSIMAGKTKQNPAQQQQQAGPQPGQIEPTM